MLAKQPHILPHEKYVYKVITNRFPQNILFCYGNFYLRFKLLITVKTVFTFSIFWKT